MKPCCQDFRQRQSRLLSGSGKQEEACKLSPLADLETQTEAVG